MQDAHQLVLNEVMIVFHLLFEKSCSTKKIVQYLNFLIYIPDFFGETSI